MELEKLKEEIEKATAAETTAAESWAAIQQALTQKISFQDGTRVSFSIHPTEGSAVLSLDAPYSSGQPSDGPPPAPEELVLTPEVMRAIYLMIDSLEKRSPGFLERLLPVPDQI